MASELTAAEKWMVARLRGDAQLAALIGGRVYVGEVPQPDSGTSVLPCLLIQAYATPRDARSQGGHRLLARGRYTVRAIGEGPSRQAIAPIYSRADDVLQRSSGTADAYVVGYCLRELPLPDRAYTSEQGERSASVGGLYEVAVQKVG